MKRFFLSSIWILAFCSWAHGAYELEYYERRAPAKSEEPISKETKMQDKRVVFRSLKGILIADDKNPPPEYVMKTTKGVAIYRTMQAISDRKKEKFKKTLTKKFIGKTLTVEDLQELKIAVQNFYQKNSDKLVSIGVREQDVKEGVIVLTVLESRLGKVKVSGHKWHSEERYLSYLHLKSDEILYTTVLEEDLNWVNRNLWRRMSVLYKPGSRDGITDVEINVEDARPLQFYAGFDNTGFKIIDKNWFFLGFNWGNFLDLDQIVSYRFTGALDLTKFQSHKVEYTVPLPWRHVVSFFGGYSYVALEPNTPFMQTGYSWALSPMYTIPFKTRKGFSQEAGFGFDWERTNNTLIVGESVIAPSLATTFQLAGTYQMAYQRGSHYLSFEGKGFWEPWKLGHSMSEEVYDLFRLGAKPQYFFAKLGAEYTWQAPRYGMGLDLTLRGQLSTKALLPTQQFGLGGIYSVRGYVQRAVNVDDAITANFELRSPEWSIVARKALSTSNYKDRLRLLAFFDVGYGSLLSTHLGHPDHYLLMGVGPAVRYNIGSWFRFRFDYGFRLTSTPLSSESHAIGQPYFSLIILF